MDENDSDRIQSLEERVTYLESIIEKFIGKSGPGHSGHSLDHDFDEVRTTIDINKTHLSQVLETSMEEQIISIILEENKRRRFMKMTKELSMYKNGWIYMEDSDLKLFIRIIPDNENYKMVSTH
jgi:hypothetical protein